MTIAIGILAKDGFVLAADSQETYAGFLKVDQPKIIGSSFGGKVPHYEGVLAISGAGTASHIEALAQELCDSFKSTQPKEVALARDDARRRVAAFYKEHILPSAHLADYDRPVVSLIGMTRIGKAQTLWVSERSAVYESDVYAAVGVGAAHANVLLERLSKYKAPMEYAIALAVYVMAHVKQHVEGCGRRTEMFTVYKDGAYSYGADQVALLEQEFARYADVEERALRYVLGLKTDDYVRELTRHLEAIRRRLRKISGGAPSRRPPLGIRHRGIRAWRPDE